MDKAMIVKLMKQSFKDQVAETATHFAERPVTFEETKVSLPKDAVWERYANDILKEKQ